MHPSYISKVESGKLHIG